MALSFAILASGSLGNCTLLECGEERLLVDCGLSPRATKKALAALGTRLDEIDAILLTHLDCDHFHSGWAKAARDLGIAVHVHERHRGRALHEGLDGRTLSLFRGDFAVGPVRVDPILFAHDDLGAVGYVIEHDGARLGYATDLGQVPFAITRRFRGLHALAIESNYDPQLQRGSARPVFLKRRIMGGRGHLSNEQALQAVLAIDECSDLAHVVALHLSRECNHPRIVQRLFARRAPHLLDRLTISGQRRPTARLCVDAGREPRRGSSRAGEQLAMW
jgi:phosphoribosyl 1,2-cyclic phosphodiesterase